MKMTRLFLCPGMGGISQGAMDGGANMYRMYGMPQGAMDGGVAMPRDGGANMPRDARYDAKNQWL